MKLYTDVTISLRMLDGRVTYKYAMSYIYMFQEAQLQSFYLKKTRRQGTSSKLQSGTSICLLLMYMLNHSWLLANGKRQGFYKKFFQYILISTNNLYDFHSTANKELSLRMEAKQVLLILAFSMALVFLSNRGG